MSDKLEKKPNKLSSWTTAIFIVAIIAGIVASLTSFVSDYQDKKKAEVINKETARLYEMRQEEMSDEYIASRKKEAEKEEAILRNIISVGDWKYAEKLFAKNGRSDEFARRKKAILDAEGNLEVEEPLKEKLRDDVMLMARPTTEELFDYFDRSDELASIKKEISDAKATGDLEQVKILEKNLETKESHMREARKLYEQGQNFQKNVAAIEAVSPTPDQDYTKALEYYKEVMQFGTKAEVLKMKALTKDTLSDDFISVTEFKNIENLYITAKKADSLKKLKALKN